MRSDRSKWLVVVALAVALGWLSTRGTGGPSFMRLPVGPMPAPAWTMPDLDGRAVASTNFAGKVVLLNFWATWCPPCVRELPELDAFHAAHEAEGFVVIGAAVDEGGAAAVKPFVERRKLGYPVVLASTKTQGLFGGVPMDPTGPAGFPLPTTFIIGRDGRFVARYVGALTQAELDKVVLPLLRR